MFPSFWPGRLPIALALLLGLRLTIHMGVGLTARAHPWENYAGRGYLDLAEALVRGDGYTGIRTCMPLYPLMLAGLLKGSAMHPSHSSSCMRPSV
jgi:hypothetical protein